MRVDKGPRENRHRPSVDVLFRSASRSYRSRVVAVVLSGALDDGASGAFIVKERGGIVIVQDPAEAPMPDMPRNTMRTVEVDYCKPSQAIAPLLQKLAKEKPRNGPPRGLRRNGKSSRIPEQTLIPIVCPDCNGPIHFEARGKQYKCEVGHSYSLKSFTAAHTETLERVLWTAIRTLGERVMLNEHLAERQQAHNPRMAERFRESAQAAERDAIILREVLDHLD
jgi:two-component system chemotaxis response regulator CheB